MRMWEADAFLPKFLNMEPRVSRNWLEWLVFRVAWVWKDFVWGEWGVGANAVVSNVKRRRVSASS